MNFETTVTKRSTGCILNNFIKNNHYRWLYYYYVRNRIKGLIIDGIELDVQEKVESYGC